ncbi:MAG: class I SAM-dependent methyltransferase [Vicinamibacterales bacterium]
MGYSDRTEQRGDRLIVSSDAARRRLSETPLEQASVGRVYEKLSSVYDFVFGPTLHLGRVQAIRRMRIKSGERLLEVGVGTGINIPLYPRDCHVTGIDFSAPMLQKARERVARKGLRNVSLYEMDAADLRFKDESFDTVFAPYLMTVVPDPIRVANEMRRVCKTGGRIVVLNHFRSDNPVMARLERMISPLTVRIGGFNSDFDLHSFLARACFNSVHIEKVNIPRVVSLVTYVKEA